MFSERKGSKVPTGVSLKAPFASLSFSLSNPSKVSFGRSLPFATIHATENITFGHPHVEPATGIVYPAEFCILTKKHCPQLAGAGYAIGTI